MGGRFIIEKSREKNGCVHYPMIQGLVRHLFQFMMKSFDCIISCCWNFFQFMITPPEMLIIVWFHVVGICINAWWRALTLIDIVWCCVGVLRPPYPVNKAYELPPKQCCFIVICVCITPSQTHDPISGWSPLPVTAWDGKLSCLLRAISHTICTTVKYQPISRRARFLILNLIRFTYNLAE